MSARCFLFPGQFSQVVGMGKAYYDHSEEVQALFEEASEIAEIDIAELCFHGPIEALTETKNLQPAMTTVVLASLIGLEEYDVIPAYVAGHSLGEYAALAAARVITKRDCLKLVTARGRLMQEQAEANPGAMIAIARMSPENIEKLVEPLAQTEVICLANYNSPEQVVASGSEAGIASLEEAVRQSGARSIRLRVSGAWHSKLMQGAEAPFNAIIDEIEFDDAKIPVLMNVTGHPETEGAKIKELMKQQMCSGVKWYQGIQKAWLGGCRTFVEVGPKGILTKMLGPTVPDRSALVTYVVDSPVALDSFLKDDEY